MLPGRACRDPCHGRFAPAAETFGDCSHPPTRRDARDLRGQCSAGQSRRRSPMASGQPVMIASVHTVIEFVPGTNVAGNLPDVPIFLDQGHDGVRVVLHVFGVSHDLPSLSAARTYVPTSACATKRPGRLTAVLAR